MAQWQDRAQPPQRSGAILQLFAILFLRGFAGFDEALSAAIQPHSDGGAGMEIPNPKTAGIKDRPSLLTPVGLRPPLRQQTRFLNNNSIAFSVSHH